MKKLLFILSLIIGLSSANAQMQKGIKETGGSFSFSSSEQTVWISYIAENIVMDETNFNFNPHIGWFISESSVLGIGLGYHFSRSTIEDRDEDEYRANMYSFQPYFRNYQKITDKLFYTTTVDFSYATGNQKYQDDTEADLTRYGISAKPGITYFVSDKWALKTSFGRLHYYQTKNKSVNGSNDEQEVTTKDFGFDLSLDSFSFGASYYF